MDRKALEEKILECASISYNKDLKTLSMDTRIKEDLGGTSMLMVGLVSLVENDLDVLLSLPEASRAVTLRDFVDKVENLMP